MSLKNIPVLSWVGQDFGGSLAQITCDSSVAQVYNIALNGTDSSGNKIKAAYLVIDNFANNGTVYLNYGTVQYSVAPYTRKTFLIPALQSVVTITLSVGTVPCSFTNYNPGVPDDFNSVLAQIAATSTNSGTGTAQTVFFSPTPDQTISGSGRIITRTNTILGAANSVFGSTDTSDAKVAGKYYLEMTASGTTIGTSEGVGFWTTNYTNLFGDITQVGNTDVICWYSDIQGWKYNGANVGSSYGVKINTGDTVQMAIDLDNKRVWARKIGNAWNGNSSANPASNTGGVSISGFSSLSKVIFAGQRDLNTSQWTINCGQVAFVGTIPVGFSQWG